MHYERTEKSSHLDTVRYEIDMLHYALAESANRHAPNGDAMMNVLIECALLHYRNLIRFFSGEKHQNGDLSMANSKDWAEGKLSTRPRNEMQRIGLALDAKYFREVSRYLQHMTLTRYLDSKQWDLGAMYADLAPAVEEFERAFPRAVGAA